MKKTLVILLSMNCMQVVQGMNQEYIDLSEYVDNFSEVVKWDIQKGVEFVLTLSDEKETGLSGAYYRIHEQKDIIFEDEEIKEIAKQVLNTTINSPGIRTLFINAKESQFYDKWEKFKQFFPWVQWDAMQQVGNFSLQYPTNSIHKDNEKFMTELLEKNQDFDVDMHWRQYAASLLPLFLLRIIVGRNQVHYSGK